MAKNKKQQKIIGEEFCFSFRSGNIGTNVTARKFFDDHKNEIDNWWLKNSTIPIFIDTNIILNAYSYPKSTRELFVNFLAINKNRIYVTDQVDEEIQRKRPNFIDNYVKSVQSLCKELVSFCDFADLAKYYDSLKVKLENIKNRPIVQNDYCQNIPDITKVISHIEEWRTETKESCDKLTQNIRDKLDGLRNKLEAEQTEACEDSDIVHAVSQCKFCEKLSKSEKMFLVNLYHECVDERERMKQRPDRVNLQMYTFPGLGDINKEKECKQREGDFFHYHEMLRQIFLLKKNAVYLTSDVKKGDTATSQMEPFDHYICNCFSLTGHVYYLVDSKSIPLASFQPSTIDIDSDCDEEDMSEAISCGQIHEEGVRSVKPFFKSVTRDVFLSELHTCVRWANEYGGKYVSKDYFIYGILGHKGYEFAKSREMLDTLVEEKIVKIETNSTGKECLLVENE